MLRDLALSGETAALEHRDGRVVAEAACQLCVLDIVRIALDPPAAKASDFGEGAVERGGRHAFSAMATGDEEAGDAPVGQVRQPGLISLEALDPRQLPGRTELAPADAVIALEDERRLRTPLGDQLRLLRAVHRRRYAPARTFGVEAHAPAAAPDAIVLFSQAREV